MRNLNFHKRLEQTYSEDELDSIVEGEILESLGNLDPTVNPCRTWIFLIGPLGAGKSTLARHLIHRLGNKEQDQGSPTFPIAHEYSLRNGVSLSHIDFYRLESLIEVENSGVIEAFFDSNIVIAEWIDKFPKVFEELVRSALPDQVAKITAILLEFPETDTISQNCKEDQMTLRKIQIYCHSQARGR